MTATRPLVAPAHSRPWPAPPTTTGGTTFHLIGDTHVGGIQSWRLDAVAAEFKTARLAAPVAHLQLGDNTDNGLAAENTKFAQFKGRFTDAPMYMAEGNHDLFNQTTDQWAAQWGYASRNYVIEFSGLRLIVIGSGSGDGTIRGRLDATTLAFLDTSLGGTTKPCIVACHYPLWDTVGGDPAVEYTSKTAAFFVSGTATTTDSTDVLAVLSQHDNLVAWVAGHTHSHITVPGLVMPVTAGSVRFASINTSCLWYCGNDHDTDVGSAKDPVNTMFATWFDSGRIEVRPRSHGGGQWASPNGNSVLSVTGL